MNAVSVCSVALLYLLTTSGSTDAISCKLSEVPVEDRMCVCVISGGPHDGQVIDLMPLSGQVFTFISKSAQQYTYSWSMCTANNLIPTTSCNTANDAAICQKDGTMWRSTGRQNTAQFMFNSTDTEIHFTQGEEDISTKKKRTTYVHLSCDKTIKGNPVITASDTGGSVDYYVDFRHELACPQSPSSPSSKKKGLSVGSVMVIIFFCVLVVYIVGGLVYLRAVRGAEGVEMFPNYSFWSSLPGLVKDGVAFLFSGCKTDSGYETI